MMQNILKLSKTFKGTLKNIPGYTRITLNIDEHYKKYSGN